MPNDTKTKKYKLQATLPAVGAAALQVLANLEGGATAPQSHTLLGLIRAEVQRRKPAVDGKAGAWEKAIALEEQLAGQPFENVVGALVELLMVELGGAP